MKKVKHSKQSFIWTISILKKLKGFLWMINILQYCAAEQFTSLKNIFFKYQNFCLVATGFVLSSWTI